MSWECTIKRAPWTLSEVMMLEDYQRCGLVHPYTCLNGHGNLIPTEAGWLCRSCNYTQDWYYKDSEGWLAAAEKLAEEWSHL